MDTTKTKLSHEAVSETYCLLTSYIREDGEVKASYNIDYINEVVEFLSDLLKRGEFSVEESV